MTKDTLARTAAAHHRRYRRRLWWRRFRDAAYDIFMVALLVTWIGTGVAGYGDAFLLLGFGLVLISGAHEWLSEE